MGVLRIVISVMIVMTVRIVMTVMSAVMNSVGTASFSFQAAALGEPKAAFGRLLIRLSDLMDRNTFDRSNDAGR